MEETNAPDLEKMTNENNDIIKPQPSVKIIGAGGAGINLVSNIANTALDINNDLFMLIDTSTSNFNVNNNHIKSFKLKDSDGSGKLRATNYEAINKFIVNELVDKEDFGDINIIVFSLAGGTGSVVAPLLIKELKRKNKLSIAIVIADSDSYVDIINTFNTLKSIDNICKKNSIYLPVMIFDNFARRTIVDKNLSFKVIKLVEILINQIDELDKTDKINWLNPIELLPELGYGMKTLFIDTDITGSWKKESGEILSEDFDTVDSMLIVSEIDKIDRITPTKRCKVIFRGYTEIKEQFIGNLGIPIPSDYLNKFNDKLNKFKNVDNDKPTNIESEYETKNKETDSGIVL